MNENHDYKIYPLGEGALTVSFGNEISERINDRVMSLANAIEKRSFRGFTECVPAYSSLTVYFDLFDIKQNFRTSLSGFEIARSQVEIEIQKLTASLLSNPAHIEIPVSFSKEDALDLDFIAASNGIDPSKAIEIFLAGTYRVFMLGFLPGFAYMGQVDGQISTPRKDTPRTRVPKGSVGIADTQTGIYPLESPGGWQIIGRTETELFMPFTKKLTLFSAGDLVNFVKA